MPSRHYYRNLRNKSLASTGIIKVAQNINIAPQENEIEKFCREIFKIIDMVSSYQDFSELREMANKVKNDLNPKYQYNKIIESIESNLISVVGNIYCGINSNIICQRIDYLKTQINLIPNDMLFNYDEISLQIMQLLDVMINDFDFTSTKTTLERIGADIFDTYGDFDMYKTVQKTLLDVVTSIECSASSHIINLRIDYVKELIAKINDKNNTQ